MCQKYIVVLVIALFCSLSAADLGVDMSSLVSQASFECMVGQGYTFASMRCWREGGEPDPNCPATMANAKAAGMTTVVYFFPDAQLDPVSQLKDSVAWMANHSVDWGVLWIDIESGNWGDCDSSYQFLSTLIQAAQQMNIPVGIYTSSHEWELVMCSASGFGDIPLWYAHWDAVPSFADWQPFAGWTTPVAKQYHGGITLCNADVDLNYVPDHVFAKFANKY